MIETGGPLLHGWKSMAQPLVGYGELSLAQRAMARYVGAMDGAPAAQFDQALLLAQIGRPSEASAILDSIAITIPDRASNAYLRGTLALNIGDMASARAHLLEASDAHPGSGQIWQTLSAIGSLVKDHDLAERIRAAEPAMAGADEVERAAFSYAIGKLYHDCGEVDAAFAAFAEGAAIIARKRPYDFNLDRENADRATTGWDADAIAALAARITVPTGRPIVVTGLPRSGSTLVEQILSSHSRVSGGDEVSLFSIIVREMGGADAVAVRVWAEARSPSNGAALYLHLLEERFGSAGRVVDKTLEASRYLGALAALAPEAPIVWMRRNPLDCAWSCLRTYFLLGLPWSWSQEAIAAHFKLEEALLNYWQTLLKNRLLVVDYEELVRTKERVVPAILKHCGLDFEPATLSPERSSRLVTTASVAQVRNPIKADAIDSAEPYREHLQPFINAYGGLN